VPRSVPDGDALARIGAALDAITEEADRAMGIHPPPPW
jgi:hypothetical protein